MSGLTLKGVNTSSMQCTEVREVWGEIHGVNLGFRGGRGRGHHLKVGNEFQEEEEPVQRP